MKKLLIILAVILLASCSKSKAIRYSISGDCQQGFNVTYKADGQTIQYNNLTAGWSESFSCDSGEDLYISSKSNGTCSIMTVTIIVDGVIQKETRNQGNNSIATAFLTCP